MNGMMQAGFENCVRQLGSRGLCEKIMHMSTTQYSNGRQQPRVQCMDTWGPGSVAIAKNIASREAARMWGWIPPSKEEIFQAADRLVQMMKQHDSGVYSSKPCSQSWNWPGWACFCNWYWWLTPESRAELDRDIYAGNYHTWAYWAMHFQELCPGPVLNDPRYAVVPHPGEVAHNTWAPEWRRQTAAAKAGAAPQGAQAQAIYDTAPPTWAPQPWPLLSLATGATPSIPGVPMQPCEPFPQCVDNNLQQMGLPQPCRPYPGCMWSAAETLANASPAIQTTSTPNRWGKYQAVAQKEDTDKTKSIVWPLLIGAGAAIGVVYLLAK